jgi:hypothetical protein
MQILLSNQTLAINKNLDILNDNFYQIIYNQLEEKLEN